MPLSVLCILILFATTTFGAEEQHAEPRAGFVLTFDDAGNINSWARQMPLFAKYEARATYFIDQADRLNETQKQLLKRLFEANHEIGCHGLRHLISTDIVKEKNVRHYL